MAGINLGEMESRFADIIWENPDIPSGELVKLCAQKLDWKKSTTYTMLRRLCEKGVFENDNGIVRCVMTKEQLAAMKGDELLKESYGGSLPRLFAAFADRKKISGKELDEIQQMIDSYRKDNGL
ncbi:MAG: BlaI/MecI/CopY family transcriptional regulator [Oscillospiraceae bacterium]|nr:BlaI/MecI/CopY family transcriptional regulator [Oscillospiraceae bacterium]